MPDITAPTIAPESTWSISLLCQEGSSNKVYHILATKVAGDLFTVDFQYGPNGGTLKSGTKTSAGPVAYPAAEKIINSLLKDKLSGGYKPIDVAGETITGYERPEDTGLRPMLLAPVDIEDAAAIEALMSNPEYCSQEKFNGHRRMVIVSAEEIYGTNRDGLRVPLSPALKDALSNSQVGVYDAEQVGDVIYVFDMIEHNGVNIRWMAYLDRLRRAALAMGFPLTSVKPSHDQDYDTIGGLVRIAKTATSEQQKRALFDHCRAFGREGVTYKDINAEYLPLARDQRSVKVKFWDTLSAVVGQVNAKRSVSLVLFENGQSLNVGNVTIPPNHEIPQPGDVIEVRYLYAYPNGSLYQPTFEMTRNDISPAECLASQRKFKDVPSSKSTQTMSM